jgi:hypothetical protein
MFMQQQDLLSQIIQEHLMYMIFMLQIVVDQVSGVIMGLQLEVGE